MKNLILILTLLLVSFCSYARCTGQVRVFDMADPVDGSPWPLVTKEYVPTYQGAPVIFILPAIVGETQLDRHLALRFCNAGMAAYILHIQRSVDRHREVTDFAIHDEAFLRAHGAVKNVIYELELRAQFLPRYGILGMSLGGVLASYVTGVERKILASTIIAGAGNTAGVLAHSDQRLVVRLRQRRMRALRIPSVAGYEAQLRAVLRIDPVDFASGISPGSMYLFIPNRDRTVPVRYQRELRDAVNAPLVYVMRASHTVGLVKATRLHGGKITSFFAKRLL